MLRMQGPSSSDPTGRGCESSPLPVAPEDIECLIVNHKSEFLNQGLYGNAEEIEIRTFQRWKEHGIE